jgi:membrane protein required for colicin V production
MAWNWLDGTIFGIVVISVVAAMWEGLIRELVSIVSFIVGLAVAALEYPRAAIWFRGTTDSPEVGKGLGFLALFLGCLIAGAVIAFLLRRFVQIAGLGWFDRFLGGIFGLVRGFAICSVLLLAMVAFSLQTPVVQNSTLAPYVLMGARVVGAALPRDLSMQFQAGLGKFKKALIEKDKKSLGQ